VIEISYSIPPSACHSVSPCIALTIRSRIQTERNQTRDTKQLTTSKILICVYCRFTSHTTLFYSMNTRRCSAPTHECKYVNTCRSIRSSSGYFLNINCADIRKLFLISHLRLVLLTT
jgi:hypothetical protein